jgi:hypothetical protein
MRRDDRATILHTEPHRVLARSKKEGERKGRQRKICQSIVEDAIGRPARKSTSMQSVVSQYRLDLKFWVTLVPKKNSLLLDILHLMALAQPYIKGVI